MRASIAVVLTALLAAWLVPTLRWAYIILVEHPLPAQYFAYGDAKTSCAVLHDDADELGFCEDVIRSQIAGRDVLLLSCDTNRHSWNTVMGPLRFPDTHGTLWLVDYTVESRFQPPKLELRGYHHNDFHPLGLALHGQTLFVVNHRKAASTIEVFQLEDSSSPSLRHIRTISGRWIVSPNSIAATSASSFYISQDHFFTRRLPFPLSPIFVKVETLLGLPLGWVNNVQLFDDGSVQVSTAVRGLSFPNGIAMDESGTQVAVASSSRGYVHLFDRDPATHALRRTDTLQLSFAPDNLAYEGGTLIAAGHPHLPSLEGVARNKPGATAGSWIVSIDRRTNDTSASDDSAAIYPSEKLASQPSRYIIRTLYQSNGHTGPGWGASTTGVADLARGKFFATGLYSKGLLECRFRA
ncbi:hypothetical protein BKA62DRAFT_687320 [Auriculariales sp. MPI-PUGE-AT-0066]|nr:hypothetical protein BKA62DRAFT_687320 [Auriculariales sp. MPI-PUGE-AT-0066]